jgi:hypothetical protein
MNRAARAKHSLGINLLACLFLFAAPFITARTNASVQLNDTLTGAVIAAAALATIWDRLRQSVGATITILAGSWLMISPFFLSYPESRVGGDFIVGCLVITASVIELKGVE